MRLSNKGISPICIPKSVMYLFLILITGQTLTIIKSVRLNVLRWNVHIHQPMTVRPSPPVVETVWLNGRQSQKLTEIVIFYSLTLSTNYLSIHPPIYVGTYLPTLVSKTKFSSSSLQSPINLSSRVKNLPLHPLNRSSRRQDSDHENGHEMYNSKTRTDITVNHRTGISFEMYKM